MQTFYKDFVNVAILIRENIGRLHAEDCHIAVLVCAGVKLSDADVIFDDNIERGDGERK